MNLRERIRLIERDAINAALTITGNNQREAASILGISRRGLILKMEAYGFKPRGARRSRPT